MNDPWVHRLSDYIDGELAAEDERELEQHLTQCEHCRVVLEDLRAILAQAGALEDHYPDRDLWTGIAEAIGAEVAPTVEPEPDDETVEAVVSIDALAERRTQRSLSLSVPQLLAACLALMILSGGVGWLLRSPGGPELTGPESTEPRMALDSGQDAVQPVASSETGEPLDVARGTEASDGVDATETQRGAPQEKRGPEPMQLASVSPREDPPPTLAEAMVGLDKRIAELNKAFVQYGETLDPETLTVLQDNLYFLDRAIFEAREALIQEPESEYLNAHLANSMLRKVRFLQQAAEIAGTEI